MGMYSCPCLHRLKVLHRSLAILLTPPGASAIAVLRLTGPLVPSFLREHVSKSILPNRCINANFVDGESVIDDPVIVLSDDSRVADVNLHGGPWVVQSALDLARRFGFDVLDRATLPLAPEAVDAGTPLEREILRFLPLAKTELAVRELLAQEEAWQRF